MTRASPPAVRFRRLGLSDAAAVAHSATAAFAGSAFYQRALGLDDRRFARYWAAFFRLAFADPAARVFAFDDAGRVNAAVAVAYDGFPRPLTGLRFLLRLLWRIGASAWLKYLRFVRAYSHVMHRPAGDRRVEACGLWLFVDPGARGAGLGADLVRTALDAVRAEGKTLATGFVDAGNQPLLTFYRRLGFTISPPFDFLGLPAATIERRFGGDDSP
ncbi:MAG: GNAT family N-acetyltransferase [Gemmatimonadales bacterium]|nr:GNAT family N-acetyltransferase [Gemmatimonadales bacterium]NIN11179.1 GNAT family N-acetyltransferase [Gemmatimonadales bacterium]NIN49778.1 GNAT family N-acetyltransferase [Gemmatimonadales bacterium]NIP07242.1 GNAT family N-acetyltransferase [Gemmatimonadales bacterium]NIR00455.1 GNAT family N-acetyltransferase [Gemmatimonadales bacterium]